MDVREHTASRDGDACEELVELLIFAHGELHVAQDDVRLFVVAGSVAGELENLGEEVQDNVPIGFPINNIISLKSTVVRYTGTPALMREA